MGTIFIYAVLLIINVMMLAVFFCQIGENENQIGENEKKIIAISKEIKKINEQMDKIIRRLY